MRRQLAIATTGLFLAFPAVGMAAAVRDVDVRPISGSSPLAEGCTRGEPVRDSEVEPNIAADPTDRQRLVAVWQADRFSDGAASAIEVGYSRDGGRSWTRVLPPGLSMCTGGDYDRVTDPVVVAGSDGVFYLSSLARDSARSSSDSERRYRIYLSRSTDGGATWTPPNLIQSADGYYHDKEWIAADPAMPGRLYAVWDRYSNVRSPGSVTDATQQAMFSRSDDGGTTWSPARIIFDEPLRNTFTSGLAALGGGSVVFPFKRGNGSDTFPPGLQVDEEIYAMRSGDGGSTWSTPVQIASVPQRSNSEEGDVKGHVSPTAAVAPDKSIYVAWHTTAVDSPTTRILIARSRDRGATWSDPIVVRRLDAEAFMPYPAVADDGTVGVIWFDLRNDREGDEALTGDWWFAHSHDGGQTWEETHLAGPFDMRTAVRTMSGTPAGLFIGDYFGMTAVPDGFAAAIVQPKPQAAVGPSDVFFAHVRLSDRPLAPATACLGRQARIGRRGIGPIRLGANRRELLGLPEKAVRRTRRSFRYCVKDSRGRVDAVVSRRGRVVVVTTTVPSHGDRRVRPGSRHKAFRDAYPHAEALGAGLYRTSARARQIVGIRRGRVRFMAVAHRQLLRNPRVLKRYLRLAGL